MDIEKENILKYINMEYSVIIVHGHYHVIVPVLINRGSYYDKGVKDKVEVPMPNYLGTGQALIGILLPGESLQSWTKRKADYHGDEIL